MEAPATAPIPATKRTLTGLDVAAIWFGAAIVISELWAGGLPALAGLGLLAGLVAILLGRLVGNGLMATVAGIGAKTGLPTMVLTRPAFGTRGALLPAFLNVVQLVGWTAWMYWIAARYMDQLAGSLGLPSGTAHPLMMWLWVGALAVLCTLCSFAGAEAWHRLLKILAAAMFLLTVWMTVLVLTRFSPGEALRAKPAGGTSLLLGTDLVIAMSVSWLPLVADYSRFAKSVRGGALGTFGGYFAGGVWMYAVGLLVAVTVGTDSPDQIVVGAMAGAGPVAVLMGLVLVLVSTVTTTFLDIYSAAVSARSILPRLPEKLTIAVVGLGGAGLAGLLDVTFYAPFLTAIGAVFVPAFAIVLADWFLLARGRFRLTGAVRWRSLLAWAAGFVVYDLAQGLPALSVFGLAGTRSAWVCGATLPCLGTTAALFLLLHGPELVFRFRRGA